MEKNHDSVMKKKIYSNSEKENSSSEEEIKPSRTVRTSLPEKCKQDRFCLMCNQFACLECKLCMLAHGNHTVNEIPTIELAKAGLEDNIMDLRVKTKESVK